MDCGGIPLIGYGAGGHARSLVETIRSGDRFYVAALVDDDLSASRAPVLGVPVRLGHEAIAAARAEGVEQAFVAIGGVAGREARRRAFDRLVAAGFALPAIVHRTASVAASAVLGDGAQVLAMAVVNAAATVGDGAILNTGAIVEHDCVVGRSAHLAPRATLGGHVTVGDGAHVGMGAVVVESVTVGAGAFVAAGAVVVADVAVGARVAGVPARPLA